MAKAFLMGLLVLVVVIAWFGCARKSQSGRIDSAQAHELVEAGARLVDVRTPEEFSAKHLPAAVNLPLQTLAGRLGELEPKDKPIVLYCRSGHRSGLAADMLRNAGFQAVHDLGPMSAW
jgi:rhodanese-related sulfurtransferase